MNVFFILALSLLSVEITYASGMLTPDSILNSFLLFALSAMLAAISYHLFKQE